MKRNVFGNTWLRTSKNSGKPSCIYTDILNLTEWKIPVIMMLSIRCMRWSLFRAMLCNAIPTEEPMKFIPGNIVQCKTDWRIDEVYSGQCCAMQYRLKNRWSLFRAMLCNAKPTEEPMKFIPGNIVQCNTDWRTDEVYSGQYCAMQNRLKNRLISSITSTFCSHSSQSPTRQLTYTKYNITFQPLICKDAKERYNRRYKCVTNKDGSRSTQ